MPRLRRLSLTCPIFHITRPLLLFSDMSFAYCRWLWCRLCCLLHIISRAHYVFSWLLRLLLFRVMPAWYYPFFAAARLCAIHFPVFADVDAIFYFITRRHYTEPLCAICRHDVPFIWCLLFIIMPTFLILPVLIIDDAMPLRFFALWSADFHDVYQSHAAILHAEPRCYYTLRYMPTPISLFDTYGYADMPCLMFAAVARVLWRWCFCRVSRVFPPLFW